MSTALDVVRAWYDTGNTDLLHQDITCHAVGYPVAQKSYFGRDAMLGGFFGEIKAQYADWSIDVERMVDAGTEVTVLGTYAARSHGGAPETFRFLHLWSITDGQLGSVTCCTEALAPQPVERAA